MVFTKNKLLLLLFFVMNSYAVSFHPLISDICSNNSSIKDTFKSYTAVNAANYPIGVEIILKRVQKYDEQNKEIREDVSNKIQWYPKQFIMQPKTQKNFRIQINMIDIPKKEYAYRLIVKEVPLKFKKYTNNENDSKMDTIKSSLKMIFTYEGFLFVKKCSYKPKLKVTYFKFNKQNNLINLEIQNIGKASTVPSSKLFDVILFINQQEFYLKGDFNKQVRLYPENKMKFKFKLSKPFLSKSLDEAQLKIVQKR